MQVMTGFADVKAQLADVKAVVDLSGADLRDAKSEATAALAAVEANGKEVLESNARLAGQAANNFASIQANIAGSAHRTAETAVAATDAAAANVIAHVAEAAVGLEAAVVAGNERVTASVEQQGAKTRAMMLETAQAAATLNDEAHHRASKAHITNVFAAIGAATGAATEGDAPFLFEAAPVPAAPQLSASAATAVPAQARSTRARVANSYAAPTSSSSAKKRSNGAGAGADAKKPKVLGNRN